MAYVEFTTIRGRELGSRSLDKPAVIGRSPDCDFCVHDILLSRRHCMLEKEDSRWVVVDLVSKNGTFVGGCEVGRHELCEGDEIRIGKTVLKFHAGKMPARESRGGAAMLRANKPTRQRAADPWEAMQATVSGFDYYKSLADRREERLGLKKQVAQTAAIGKRGPLPTPQPQPRDPESYGSEDVYSLLDEIMSNSWDSIYMTNSRPAPTRPAPRPIARHPRYRGGAPVDMSLALVPRKPLRIEVPPRVKRPAPSRWKAAFLKAARAVAMVGQSVMVIGMVHMMGII